MKPRCTAIGHITKSEIIQIQEKKPFIGISMECSDPALKYPTKVKVILYAKDVDERLAELPPGTLVAVEGEASVEAYISKKTQKPNGAIKIFASVCSVIGEGSAPAPQRQSAPPQRQSQPAGRTAAPAPEDDDVPF